MSVTADNLNPCKSGLVLMLDDETRMFVARFFKGLAT